jgi:hypothetical protein
MANHSAQRRLCDEVWALRITYCTSSLAAPTPPMISASYRSLSLSLFDQGKGVPDLAARRFVRMLKDTLPSLVVLALCDYDPWGLQILCTYAFGSQVRR